MANLACFCCNLVACLASRGRLIADLSTVGVFWFGRARVATFECWWNSRVSLFSVLKTTRRLFSPPAARRCYSRSSASLRLCAFDFFFFFYFVACEMVSTSSLPVLPASPGCSQFSIADCWFPVSPCCLPEELLPGLSLASSAFETLKLTSTFFGLPVVCYPSAPSPSSYSSPSASCCAANLALSCSIRCSCSSFLALTLSFFPFLVSLISIRRRIFIVTNFRALFISCRYVNVNSGCFGSGSSFSAL